MDDKYEDLANAIVLTAVKDYRDALKKLEKYPNNKILKHTKMKLKDSSVLAASTLTNIDPEFLIKELNEEVI